MTQYFSIRSDTKHSQHLATTDVVDTLKACFPKSRWVQGDLEVSLDERRLWLTPVAADSRGNFASDGSLPAKVNLIDVRASYEDWPNEADIARSLDVLCHRLGWELVNNDDVVLLPVRPSDDSQS
jgi:hypothetical protein